MSEKQQQRLDAYQNEKWRMQQNTATTDNTTNYWFTTAGGGWAQQAYDGGYGGGAYSPPVDVKNQVRQYAKKKLETNLEWLDRRVQEVRDLAFAGAM